jgi:hypothetical protein
MSLPIVNARAFNPAEIPDALPSVCTVREKSHGQRLTPSAISRRRQANYPAPTALRPLAVSVFGSTISRLGKDTPIPLTTLETAPATS